MTRGRHVFLLSMINYHSSIANLTKYLAYRQSELQTLNVRKKALGISTGVGVGQLMHDG